MTIKRTKHRVGPFDRTKTEWTLVDDDGNNVERAGEMAEIGKAMQEALSPRGRIRRWREHADRLNVAGDLLDAAEALMDERGTVERIDRFDALLAQAEISIERAQNEALDVYGETGRAARHKATLSANRERHNADRRAQSAQLNARLVRLDDSIARDWPRLSQTQRARKILEQHAGQLPESIRTSNPESLAKRIRGARK